MSESAQEFGVAVEAQPGVQAAAGPAAQQPRKGNLLQHQQALVAMGRRALSPPELPILMQDAAALLAEVLDTESSCVSRLSADGRSLNMRLALGESGEPEPRIVSEETSAEGADSLAGYVLEVAHPVIVTDLSRETRFADPFLLKHGIASAVAVPLQLQDRSFGSLGAYSRRHCRFDDEEVLFVETIAHLVATTIARANAEQSLADERRLASGVLQTIDALVLVLSTAGQITHVNPACERATGFSLAELTGRPVWNALVVPDEAPIFQRAMVQLREGTSPLRFESRLLTKHSQRRRVAWSYSAMRNANGELESIIASGLDITEQREAEQKAKQAEEAAEEVRKAMAELVAASDKQESDTKVAQRSETLPPADEPTVSPFGELPIPINAERRKRPRRYYPYRQKVAAVIDGKLPEMDQFVEVECNDIAAGGFSFLTTRAPASDTLVVALGIAPRITFLTAHVAHVTPTQRGGRKCFVVGCAYVGRARY